MEKKEIGTATILNNVNGNTKFLGMVGGELVQYTLDAIPEATGEAKGFMGSNDKVNIDRSTFKNFYSYTKGLLLKTDIAANTDEMVSVEIKGNLYNSPLPQDSVFHFYQYTTGNSIERGSGIANGSYIDLNVFNYEGYLCLWIDPIYTNHGLNVNVYTARHGSVNSNTNCYNRIVQAINMALPTTGISRFKLIKPRVSNDRIAETLASFDANSIKDDAVITSSVWQNTPASAIGILEVVRYSADWIYQKFTQISATPSVWHRSFVSGTTWGGWIKI